MGFAVVVGANRSVKTVGTLLFHLARFDRVHFYDTLDEARAFLRQQIAKQAKRDEYLPTSSAVSDYDKPASD